MNFIFVSPNFPDRYFKWVEALKERGINVLGIGDTPWDGISDRLKNSLTEYYWLPNLSDYGAMLNACHYFESKYGKIDYIESNNEWWLFQDAELRKDMGVTTGFLPEDMMNIKAKSEMKKSFQKGGAKTMRYILVDGPEDIDKSLRFASEVGFPVFVKPNIGVGAIDSFKLKNEDELRSFLKDKLPETYIMEEYISGFIVSFDGICDSKSNVVFATTDHFPTVIAEVVNDVTDYCYFSNPFELPFKDMKDRDEFLRVGKKVVKAFGIKQRFFHIEFFVLDEDRPGLAKKGEFVALECNMRPAGGYTPDLINFAASLSCYDIYADVIAYDKNLQDMGKEKYYAFASARRFSIGYAHSMDEVYAKYGNEIVAHGYYPPHIAVTMGDEYVYAKFNTHEEGIAFDSFVREKIKR